MSSILWGPLHFIWDGAPENQVTGWIATVLLVAAMLSFPVHPRGWTTFLAAVAIPGWLFAGLLGSEINL